LSTSRATYRSVKQRSATGLKIKSCVGQNSAGIIVCGAKIMMILSNASWETKQTRAN